MCELNRFPIGGKVTWKVKVQYRVKEYLCERHVLLRGKGFEQISVWTGTGGSSFAMASLLGDIPKRSKASVL